MSCYHPLSGFYLGFKTENGKDALRVFKADLKEVSIYDKKLNDVRSMIPLHGDHIRHDLTFVKINNKSYDNYFLIKRVDIPCGHCIGCRLDYSRKWAIRCIKEKEQYQFNYFLTLTYDDDHLVSKSLIKKDFQDFMKRLREFYRINYNHDNIRFFACGEYGPKNLRPHFHAILFNLPIYDLKIVGCSARGDRYFESAVLSKIWKNGFVTVGEVTFDSCAYVARYVLDKVNGPTSQAFYDNFGIVPEFVLMSRHPGIGFNYYNINKNKIYSNDEIFYKKGDLALRCHSLSYYDRLYEIEEPDKLYLIKKKRLSNALFLEQQRLKDYVSKKSMLELDESIKNDQLDHSKMHRKNF